MLTELEKSALLLRYWNGEKTFVNAFKLSHQTTANKISINALVSRWKNKADVKDFVNDIITKFNSPVKRAENRQKGAEIGTGETTAGNYINFRDLDEFLNYCETRANVITDEKDRQKYLQMISELMRYKEHGTNDNELQRFYTPLKCHECPIYNNLLKEGNQEKDV